MDTLEQINTVRNNAKCLFSAEELDQKISNVALQINATFSQQNPLIYAIMNGGLIFTGKLLTQLSFPLRLSYIHATRYRNQTSGSNLLEWKVAPEQDLNGETIVLLDDILDEGQTLGEIIDYCYAKNAKKVYTAVLAVKHHNHKKRTDIKADFYGVDVPDDFIFGYGLDYKGYWRNAPGLYSIKDI